jgi:hypothetical protein
MRLEQVGSKLAVKALSAVIPIPLVGFTLFWRESDIKVNLRQAAMTRKKVRVAALSASSTGAFWSNGPHSTPCFVSVQNARKHRANLSSEC